MRRLLFTSALFVALGCGEASRPPAAAGQHARSLGVSSRYAPGQQDTYRVSWSSQSVARGPAFLPQDAPIQGGLTLEGTLVASWYATEGTPRVGLSLTEVHSASVTLMGANIVGPLEELVGVEVIASLDEEGAVRSVHIPRDASPLARTMLGSLVGRLDFRAPSTGSAVAVVPSTPRHGRGGLRP